MAEIKWIKLTTDMFDNRKIKHLRKLPEGNNVVLIWVMLLTLAGRCNAGGMIFLTENIPYTTKMLADELDFEENTVNLALKALSSLGMITTNNEGLLAITDWEDHQNIDGMERIREQNRIRKQRQRELKKQMCLPEAPQDSHGTVTGQSPDVTQQNKNKNKDIRYKELYNNIVEYLNQKAGTKFKPTTAKTKTAIHARLSEGFSFDDFITVIDKKCAEWIGTEYEKYLRPETLFGTKFEGYLNAKTKSTSDSEETPDFLKKWSV